MGLKRQLTRLLVVGGLAVMTAGLSRAGYCGEDQWCWHPKAVSQPVTAQPSLFAAFWTILSAVI